MEVPQGIQRGGLETKGKAVENPPLRVEMFDYLGGQPEEILYSRELTRLRLLLVALFAFALRVAG